MNETPFFKQAELLHRIMPFIAAEKTLALRGGTAINYFIRNFPRISVDVDLIYLPLVERKISLLAIMGCLEQISLKIKNVLPLVSVRPKVQRDNTISSLYVIQKDIQVKIEVNTVVRGTIFPCREMKTCSGCEQVFQQSYKSQLCSFADLYGSKICAALDRQHPRDLFDVKLLLENEGITEEIRKAFIVYLISHSRPMVDLLDPHFTGIREIFMNEFQGMARIPVTLDELLETRVRLVQIIRHGLTRDERTFILSVKEKKPQWDLLGIGGVDQLPAVQWKLRNLEAMDAGRHRQAVDKLKECLEVE